MTKDSDASPPAETRAAGSGMSRASVMFLMVVAGLAYFGLAKLGMTLFALTPSNITLLWLPSGVALVMCLLWGVRAAPVIFIAAFWANIHGLGGLDSGKAWLHCSISSLIDALSGLVAAFLFRKTLSGGLRKAQDLLPFILLVCLPTTAFVGLGISTNLYVGGYIPFDEVEQMIRMLIFADTLGIILVYPVFQGWMDRKAITVDQIMWLIAGIIFILFISALIVAGEVYVLYFIVPVMLALSFRLDLAGVGLLTALSIIMTTAFTAHGLGPLPAGDALTTNFKMMAFSFSAAIAILGISLQNEQIERSEGLVESWRAAANIDDLTQIFNRRAFVRLSEDSIRNSNLARKDGLRLLFWMSIISNRSMIASDMPAATRFSVGLQRF